MAVRSSENPYDNLPNSSVFRSSMVVEDFQRIGMEMSQLASLTSKFPDFDLEGKKMYLQKMEEACESYRIFLKRMELADDPASKEFLRYMNAQMLNGGFTLQVGEPHTRSPWARTSRHSDHQPVQSLRSLQAGEMLGSISCAARSSSTAMPLPLLYTHTALQSHASCIIRRSSRGHTPCHHIGPHEPCTCLPASTRDREASPPHLGSPACLLR